MQMHFFYVFALKWIKVTKHFLSSDFTTVWIYLNNGKGHFIILDSSSISPITFSSESHPLNMGWLEKLTKSCRQMFVFIDNLMNICCIEIWLNVEGLCRMSTVFVFTLSMSLPNRSVQKIQWMQVNYIQRIMWYCKIPHQLSQVK